MQHWWLSRPPQVQRSALGEGPSCQDLTRAERGDDRRRRVRRARQKIKAAHGVAAPTTRRTSSRAGSSDRAAACAGWGHSTVLLFGWSSCRDGSDFGLVRAPQKFSSEPSQ